MIFFKTINALFLAVLLPFFILAQNATYPVCGTPNINESEFRSLPWMGNNAYLTQMRDSARLILARKTGAADREGSCSPDLDGVLVLPIHFFNYGSSNNDPLFPSLRKMQVLIDQLNDFYRSNGVNVRFFAGCSSEIVDEDMATLTNWEQFLNGTAFGFSANTNVGIPIHVVQEISGASGIYFPVQDCIVVTADIYSGNASRVSTLAHEIGHYFGLAHTHQFADVSGTGFCLAEPVSRTRTAPFGLLCNFLTNKPLCETTGDALCDTPADPNLLGKITSDCIYNAAETDHFGDAFVPDITNIMSYSFRLCRSTFSQGQKDIMYHRMVFGRGGRYAEINGLHVNPDQYEPDNDDTRLVPRSIAIGETQCHTFHDMSCGDPADWLIIDRFSSIIGSYVVEIEDWNNVVGDVKVWNQAFTGLRSTEITASITTVGTKRFITFPCSAATTDILLDIRRKDVSAAGAGNYIVSLRQSSPVKMAGSTLACNGATFEITGLPAGSSVIWAPSPSITLNANSGSTTSITSVLDNGTSLFLIAFVSLNGCVQSFTRQLTFRREIPNFNVTAPNRICYSSGKVKNIIRIPDPAPETNYTWTCSGMCNDFFVAPNGLSATLTPTSVGSASINVIATDACGNRRAVNRIFGITRCYDGIGKVSVNPNPTDGLINIDVEDDFDISGAYEITITNQLSEVKRQEQFLSKQFNLDVGDLQDGVYYLRVVRDGTAATVPFIINK